LCKFPVELRLYMFITDVHPSKNTQVYNLLMVNAVFFS